MLTRPQDSLKNEGQDAAVGMTRRSLLQRGATGAAAVSLATMWAPAAQASSGQGGTLSGALLPRGPGLMLINRLTHGWTTEEGDNLSSLGFSGYRQSLLYPVPPNPALPNVPFDESELEALLYSHPLFEPYLNGGPAFIDSLDPGLALLLVSNLKNSELIRAIAAKDQAREKAMEFWRDHFNVHGDQEGQFLGQTRWLREVLRENALGTFPEMLIATAHDAAMLLYLDQYKSGKPVPNENYARELMELHTLSPVDLVTNLPNYTESDVAVAAKALTGWSFVIDPADHPGKDVFDFVFKRGLQVPGAPGNFLGPNPLPFALDTTAGDEVLARLIDSSATENFISYKLLRWYVGYEPTTSDISNVASFFPAHATGAYPRGDIRVLLTATLTHSRMYNAGLQPSQLLLRRPSEFAIALCRALKIHFTIEDKGLLDELHNMGNAPLEWPAPDGYAHSTDAWVNGIFARWQLANKLLADPVIPQSGPDPYADDRLPGIGISDDDLVALVQPFSSEADITDHIDYVLTGGVMTPNEKCVVTDYLVAFFADPANDLILHRGLRDAFALAASSPTFQYR